jgi:hypothetical protein
MSIVATNSPLLNLPAGLPPLQASYLDALRISIHAADVAYERLVANLDGLNHASPDRQARGLSAHMDAWTVVDTVARLRALVQLTPGYKKKASSRKLFLKRTEVVRSLRNTFQHLDGDLGTLTAADAPVLGSLTWICPVAGSSEQMEIGFFMPGQFRSIDPTSIVQLPNSVPPLLGQVELWLGREAANISHLHSAVADLASALEKPLRSYAAAPGTTPSDIAGAIRVELLPLDS